jgi:hypothetical protein
MPATLEERLDELLAMSRDVGRLAREVAHSEQELAFGVRLSRDKPRLRSCLRALRKEYQQTSDSLARSRARLLAALPAEGAAL